MNRKMKGFGLLVAVLLLSVVPVAADIPWPWDGGQCEPLTVCVPVPAFYFIDHSPWVVTYIDIYCYTLPCPPSVLPN